MIDREGFGPLPWFVWLIELGCVLALLGFLWPALILAAIIIWSAAFLLAVIQA